jgi:hypothetical protein
MESMMTSGEFKSCAYNAFVTLSWTIIIPVLYHEYRIFGYQKRFWRMLMEYISLGPSSCLLCGVYAKVSSKKSIFQSFFAVFTVCNASLAFSLVV